MRHQILRTAIYISYLNRNLPRLIKVFPEAFDDATLVIKHDKACQLRGRYLLKKRDRRHQVACENSCFSSLFAARSEEKTAVFEG